MKKTIFSKGIYAESLRRLRVLGFLCLAAMLILQSIPVIIQLTSYTYYLNDNSPYKPNVFEAMPLNFETVLMSCAFMTIFVAPIMVLSLFSVFNKRASSDFYHSLPYTRTCIFVSKMAAVYTWVIGVSATCSLLGLITYTCPPHLFVLSWGGGLDLLLSYFAILLVTTGGCALAMAITGTIFSNFCVAGLILFLPRVIIILLSAFISDRAEFLVFNASGNSFLSPTFNVLFASFGGGAALMENLSADIYSICLGIAYLALALLVFVKRKSETATCPAPDRLWQHVIRITITMAFALIPVIFLVEVNIAAFIIFSLITVLIYFAYEIISTRKWKNCVKAIPGLAVVAGLSIVLVLAIIFIPELSSKYTPDTDDIDSVQLLSNGEYYYYGGYGGEWYGMEAQKLKVTDEKVREIVSEALKENMENYEKNGSIYMRDNGKYSSYLSSATTQTVAIRNGLSVHYRNIAFTEEQHSALLNALQNDEKYIKAIQTLPKPAKGSISIANYNDIISDKDEEKIFESLQKEMYKLSIEDVYEIAKNYTYEPGAFNIFYYTDDFSSMNVDINIDSDHFPKTFEMLLDITSAFSKKGIDELDDILLDPSFFEENEVWYANVDSNVKITTKDGESRYYYLDTYYHDGDDTSRWDELESTEVLAKAFEAAKNAKGKADATSYISFSYNCDFGKGESEEEFKESSISYYGTVYLPVPENFDPEEYGYSPMDYYEGEIEYYD